MQTKQKKRKRKRTNVYLAPTCTVSGVYSTTIDKHLPHFELDNLVLGREEVSRQSVALRLEALQQLRVLQLQVQERPRNVKLFFFG